MNTFAGTAKEDVIAAGTREPAKDFSEKWGASTTAGALGVSAAASATGSAWG
jgi:hypothetical protein